MNYIINKTKLASRSLAAIVIIGLSITNLSANEIVLPHSDYGNGWESFIMGDTTSTGEQNHHIYKLESSKVYYQQVPLRVHHSMELHGTEYNESEGGFPATIQQIPGADGSLFNNWPASNILTYGEGQIYVIHNLLFNGSRADASGHTFGVMAAYGEYNEIIIDRVTSVHNEVISYMSMGHMLGWEFTNNKAVQYSPFPQGMYFGGFFWGGGQWVGGPLKHLIMLVLENLLIA